MISQINIKKEQDNFLKVTSKISKLLEFKEIRKDENARRSSFRSSLFWLWLHFRRFILQCFLLQERGDECGDGGAAVVL